MKVGDYVRTKKGIAKIIGKNDDVRYLYPNAYITDTYLEINDDTEYVYEEDIIKSSPNIMDLIEVGDYVNGMYVAEIISLKNNTMICMVDSDYECTTTIKNEDIKSIVTKEMYSSVEYRVESN